MMQKTLLNNVYQAKTKTGAKDIAKLLQARPGYKTILLAGDIHFSHSVAKKLDRKKKHYPTQQLLPIFKVADYRIVNLETTLSAIDLPIAGIKYPFSAHKNALKVLQSLKVDQVIMANNHAMDYREESMLKTMQILQQQNIAHVGVGENSKIAMQPHLFSLSTIDFATYAISLVGRSHLYAHRNAPGVAGQFRFRDLKQKTKQLDQIIVSIHWGREYYLKPTPAQKRFARKLIRNGAHIVFGHHPHVPQGIEFFQSGVIIYSVGNLAFGTYHELQNHNIIILADFSIADKRLAQLRIVPINGRYWENGSDVYMLSAVDRKNFADYYLVLLHDQFPKTAAKATIEDGIITFKL